MRARTTVRSDALSCIHAADDAVKPKTSTAEDASGARTYLRPQPRHCDDGDTAVAADCECEAAVAIDLTGAESSEDGAADLTLAQRAATQVPARAPRLIGERAHRFHFLDAQQVDYLEVDGNYVTIHVGEDCYLTRTTLKHLCAVLAPYDFVRIDRAVLVNLQQVDYIERLESGQFAFRLHGGQQLVSSRERCGPIGRLLRGAVR